MDPLPPSDDDSPSAGEISGEEDAVELPIEDVLDLHAFHPRDVKAVVEEYLAQCRARGFAEVRIVHGRGTGVQRAIVRSILERSPDVLDFGDAGGERGGWGATIVQLRPPDPGAPAGSSREG
jgi:DNA-nicking Smr family endonuclease